MSQLHVEATGATDADPETVWSLIADANSYSRWGPWSDGGYRPSAPGPSRKGQIQWFRYGRRTVSIEEILEVDAPHRLVYAVVKGLPVKNYRADITLTPRPSKGTQVRWAATWDRTFLGKLVHRRLQKVYAQVVGSLVAAAGRQASADKTE